MPNAATDPRRPGRTRTRVKLCGFVRPEDVDAAVAIGADAIGFVFYPRSPRVLGTADAARLRRRLPSWVQAVGLFVNAGAAQIDEIHRRVGLDVLQLHGDETPEDALRLVAGLQDPGDGGRPGQGGGLRGWWKALRIEAGAVQAGAARTGRASAGAANASSASSAAEAGLPDASLRAGRVPADRDSLAAALQVFEAAEHCLLDSASAGFGGSGHRFDWSLIPPGAGRRLILSGGLDAATVGDAIRRIRPFAVDASSGIQGADARRKDVGRMERFMTAVQEADSRDPVDGTGQDI